MKSAEELILYRDFEGEDGWLFEQMTDIMKMSEAEQL